MPRRSRLRPSRFARPFFEELESRALPATVPWPGLSNPIVEAEGNDTLNLANDLGSASATGRLEAVGTIGDSPAGAADVDWFKFTLTSAATVRLRTLNEGADTDQVSVLGLYGSNPADPTNFAYQFRLIAQDDGADRGGDAELEYTLGPGTYFVAVSGSGNRHFHPHLAASGLEGSTGDYGLLLTADNLATVPKILATDPADGAELDRSPLAVRVRLSAALSAGQTLSIRDENDNAASVTFNFNATIREARLILRRALAEGTYRISLRAGAGVELEGTSFTVSGVEGAAGAGAAGNDSADTAIDLGDITSAGPIQRTGAIGDDPFYDPTSADPTANRLAADVDLYHFRLSGPGRFALISEVFAQRLGLGLNPGLSLFRRDEDTGELVLVAGNNNTFNPVRSALNTPVLQFDPALFAGLTAGDYYLAVSATGNVPDPLLGLNPGDGGIFDPNAAHSGSVGTTTGAYVLNVRVQADNLAPRVTATTPAAAATLAAPPTTITVTFDEPVNLQQLGYAEFQQTPNSVAVPAVFVRGSDGIDYVPRFISYDTTTNQATFLMLEPLPNGAAELHLSPGLGLSDLAGNALAGNDPSGDFVVRFSLNAPPRGSAGDPLVYLGQEPNDSLEQPQAVGALFPLELQNGVTFRRDFTADPGSAPADTEDFFQFEVLQSRPYIFTMPSEFGLPPGTRPQLHTPAGTVINVTLGAPITLAAGTYVVRLGGWLDTDAASVTYDLVISNGASAESPTPLTAGPAPALRIRLASVPPVTPSTPGATPSTPSTPVVVNVPTTNTTAPNLAPGLLIALRSGPVGGETGGAAASSSADRLALGDTGTGPGGGLRTLLLTLTLSSTDEQKKDDSQFAEVVSRVWKEFLDGMPWLGGMSASLGQLADPAAAAVAEALVDEVFRLDGGASIIATGDEDADVPAGEMVEEEVAPWLALEALGLVAAAGRVERGRRRRALVEEAVR